MDYQYGADGRINAMPGFVSSVTYRPTGDLSHLQYLNGISLDNTYDTVTNWLTRARAVQQTTGLAMADSTYGYTPGGHLSSIQDAVGTGTQTFQMDHLYRLTQAASPASYGTLGYAYDALGNMTTKAGITFSFADPNRPHQTTSTSTGQSLTYDLTGNVRSILNADPVRATAALPAVVAPHL